MPLDRARYRQIIGHFATGVTVITTNNEGHLHGMTANAVTSVSLDPVMLLVCVDKKANMHVELPKAGRFAINMLRDGQEAVSRTFAETTEPEEGRLQGVGYRPGPHGVPLLDNALAYLECEVEQAIDAGDHTIYMANVVSGDVGGDGSPLIFYRGGYCKLQR